MDRLTTTDNEPKHPALMRPFVDVARRNYARAYYASNPPAQAILDQCPIDTLADRIVGFIHIAEKALRLTSEETDNWLIYACRIVPAEYSRSLNRYVQDIIRQTIHELAPDLEDMIRLYSQVQEKT